jgi:hypothetical protein
MISYRYFQNINAAVPQAGLTDIIAAVTAALPGDSSFWNVDLVQQRFSSGTFAFEISVPDGTNPEILQAQLTARIGGILPAGITIDDSPGGSGIYRVEA